MIAENINDIDTNSIIVCDPIKNSVMQYSNFYKIVYSNDLISLNGLYLIFDLKKVHHSRDKLVFNYADNKDAVDKIAHVEKYILDLICSTKNRIYKITELLTNGNIKYSYNDTPINTGNTPNYNNYNCTNKSLILKISGLWETKENVGVTFKLILVENSIDFNVTKNKWG
ncbi:hypothetical protein PGAG_00239 [Phaeocystis globosa virus 12T]|uniref:Uncharacterized protein n=1 Tax=Phaeocystis globosa virus PgV-16T TaxID=3071227 RepID=A0AC59EXD5_9VIRU|nr:hypothetical protein PGCG_00279 [Phaeocystis globosa virus]AET73128.1 hypothetical protein PGAG_00239 [Phaeocystis globosa virus 12T]AET73951.1 hypothetical protein PGBG_00243 [Phaeocystis globosa virus 14T]AGM15590.1 hypothetical protein PGCG_00279 [Phaeocystis globosa virus PgV-16T]UYE94320.1 DUF2738/DUF5871 family protein [Phaeocystis globosa virus]